MKNNQQFRNRRKSHRSMLLWIIPGIAILSMLGAAFLPSLFNRDKPPPQPKGELRYPNVKLIVHSNVGGAEVYLNGEKRAVISTTHQKATLIGLAPKTYQITLKKQGYVEKTVAVEITGKDITQNVQIDMAPDEADTH